MDNRHSARYVVISPMKNEEKYVAKTLEAMISQTLPPAEWVIVDDGSTDRSAEIVASYAQRHPWIRLKRVSGLGNRKPEHYGGHVVDLFYDGMEGLQTTDTELVVKLDCDVSFDSKFFETLVGAFVANPKLGISSGISFALQNGVLAEERTAPDHTLGATKMYRKKCLADIGGLVRSMGWDGIDEIKARMLGWEARPLRELIFIHHRPEGLALGLYPSGVERGKGSHFMGYHPMFLVARALGRILKPGLAADGFGMLAGYFGAVMRREPQVPDPDLIRYIRKNQIRKLSLRRSEI